MQNTNLFDIIQKNDIYYPKAPIVGKNKLLIKISVWKIEYFYKTKL